jgi:pimeloyl-ACP methyl ester carboxylesterase
VPTLLFWGDKDQILHHTCVEAFKQLIPHAQSVKLANVGHLPMVDVPGTTATHLNRFWRDSRSAH